MKKLTSISLALLAALASTAALAQVNIPLPGVAPKLPGPQVPPGLYVSVTDGSIVVANRGGATNFAPGQFGYTATVTTPPVPLPANPALKFTLPPQFAATAAPSAATVAGRSGAVDCVVR